MDLQADIKWISQELKTVKDPILIEAFKNMLKKYRRSVMQSSERISIEQYNKEIDEAVKDIENGEYYTQKQAKKISDKW